MKYIYVVENPVDLDININEFYKIMKYKEGYKVRNVLSFNDDDRGDEIIRVYALMDRAFPETGDVASVKKMAAKAVVAKPVVEEIPPLAMHELDDKQVKMIGKCFAKNYKKGKISAKYQQMRSDNNNLLISNLLGDQQTFQCCFCRKVFNLAMLNPVCIKPITACQANEIKDVAHNTIFLCKTGCEALFSNGFVVVNETGTIKRNAENAAVTDDLSREIGHLNNKVVTVYDDTNKKYFADHFAQYSKK